MVTQSASRQASTAFIPTQSTVQSTGHPALSAQNHAQPVRNLPEKKFAAGGISATIWSNEKEVNGAPVSIRTVSLTRSYKDKDGQWKQSASMRVGDIPKAQLVLEKAFEYLTLKESDVINVSEQ